MKKRIHKTKKRINKKIPKKENTNKNTNKNNNVVHLHFGNHKKPIYGKSIIKREIVKVPEIKTFTPLHQLTNYVPMTGVPQTNMMMSHPSIPSQQSIVHSNPLANPLRDMAAGNVFQTQQTEVERARMLAKKEVEREFQKQLQQWKEKEEIGKGKKVGEILDKKFGQTYEQPTTVTSKKCTC